jgi:F0F1-type ATP synthase membrane subunit b/b'
LGVEVGTKFAVFNTSLVLLWYLGVARILEILEKVERMVMKGLIEIEQSSSQ